MDGRPENQQQDGESGNGSRILVIDDERTIHVALTRILGRQGHRVDAVFGGPDGLERLAAHRYDLVITDLMMPEMNGMELLQAMRAKGYDVPVLMITGYPTIRTALEALRLGAVDYVSKPFTREEVLGPVQRTLRRPAAPSPAPPAGTAPADADRMATPQPEPVPGDRFFLREHSWAVYQQDGTVAIGIEASFLDTLDRLASLELPSEDDLIEQGFVGFKLTTASGERHNVFVPLSGRVVSVNQAALTDFSSVGVGTWLVRIQPQRPEIELPLLVKSE